MAIRLAGFASPMSDTPRNKVNILTVCAANTIDAYAKIEAAKKAGKDAEDQVSAIKSRHNAEIDAANLELSRTATLIQENEREGVPTEKLEKKAADIKEKIKKQNDGFAGSKEFAAAQEAVEKAAVDLKNAEDLHQLCKEREKIAEDLKVAFEQSSVVGAVEALEYQTLDEAIEDYMENIPLIVSVSNDMTVDSVGMWQVPNASVPYQSDVSAKKGVAYRYNRLPSQLEWLSRFPKSEYSSMPKSGESEFKVGNVVFVISKGKTEDDAENEGEENDHSWMGKMASRFQSETPSLFSPEGINYTSERGVYARSGLCYIKSEGKFYSVWNTKFPSVEMVPGKVKRPDRWGTMQTEDGLVPKGVNSDVSKLFESFFKPVAERIKASADEFEDLSAPKSRLALRLKEALDRVCVVESTFEIRGKRLTEAEVNQEVGAYWEAFIKAPWEQVVVGDVAMIKHLCERKIEVPHVWSLSMKGHYGLRVRTRDHDWIIAQIYCPPGSLSPKAPIAADDVVYLSNGLVKVGPCYIIVAGRQK